VLLEHQQEENRQGGEINTSTKSRNFVVGDLINHTNLHHTHASPLHTGYTTGTRGRLSTCTGMLGADAVESRRSRVKVEKKLEYWMR
jgi:hypothetical protein